MNKEEIDKWLDNEYGVSYTSLEEIHDWLVDENMKKDKEIERLQEELDKTRLSELNKEYIINELEKWCLSWKENDKYCYLASNDKDKCRYDIWEEVLEKLQELKGDSSNEIVK